MTSCARSDIIQLGKVAVYHCWNRCVRRAFLCGDDPVAGKNYEYRRNWICQMEEHLAALFGIEVGFHGELSNHLHLVLRTRPDVVATWSDHEVMRRWLTITKLAKSRDGQIRTPAPARIAMELTIPGYVDEARKHLEDPSWFMAILCEYVGRRSNREDNVTGVFFEDRYKCRELADEASILVCGIYVDLNQIRAGEALTPEASVHTSAYDRIRARQDRATKKAKQKCSGKDSKPSADGWLCELTLDEQARIDSPRMLQSATNRRATDKGLIPISLDDYLRLLDASGRIIRQGKTGAIPKHLAPIVDRLGIKSQMWPDLITDYDQMFGHIVGASERVAERAAEAGRCWFRGARNCATSFG